MKIQSQCSFELPAWVEPFLVEWQQPLSSIEARMRLAVALSKESVLKKTGGPFGAVVVHEETGELVSVGINLVTTAGLSIARHIPTKEIKTFVRQRIGCPANCSGKMIEKTI